ncbi:MAG: creatininase family protein [Candidatus Binatia bacterium]
MYHLSKLRFPEVEGVARSGRSLVILPVGAVEEHGPHLPLGLDTFAAEAYAETAAPHLEDAGYTVILAPAVSYGVARQAIDFAGTLTLEPATLRALIIDIARSLAGAGFKRQVILNGHGEIPHVGALEEAARAVAEEETARIICVGFTSDPAITNACVREGTQGLSRSPRPDREGHAGEWETSLALYCFPNLLDKQALQKLDSNFDYDVDALRTEKKNYWTLTAGRGYFGSPGAASPETGRALLTIRGRNIAQVILKAFH